MRSPNLYYYTWRFYILSSKSGLALSSPILALLKPSFTPGRTRGLFPRINAPKKEDRENLRLPEFYVALSDNKLEDKESASDYHKDAKTNHC